MAEAVFEFEGQFDAVSEVLAAHERDERHHLFFGDERVRRVGLTEQQLCSGGDSDADQLGQLRGVETDQIAVEVIVIARLRRRSEREFREGRNFAVVQPKSPVTRQRVHELIEDRLDGEDFLLTDAEEVVVVGGTLHDRGGCVFQARRFVNDHGRVARSGDDGLLAALHRGASDCGSARHTQQFDLAMTEDRGGGFERGLLDDRDQVFESGRFEDRLVEAAHPFAGDASTTRMRVHNERVSARDHVDHVARQRRQRMRHRSDRTDDPERRVLGDAQPVIATHRVSPHELNTRDELDDLELLDLVIEPSDLRLLEFERAEFLSLRVADLAHALDGL